MNLLLLEAAVWWRHLFAKPWRRRKVMQPRRVYLLIAFTFCWELALTLRVIGLVRPLGGW